MLLLTRTIIINLVFTIERPVEKVFAYLIDPVSVPEWQTDISEQVKVTAGPMKIGTILRNTKKSLWGNYKYERKVMDFILLNTYSFYNYNKSLEFKIRYDLEPVNDRTRITVSGEFKKPTTGIYSFIPQWMLKYGIKKVLLDHNKLLKHNIEKKFLK